jgi:serine/threonine-protein kinase
VTTARSRAEVHGDALYYVKQTIDLQTFNTIGEPIPLAEPAFCFTPTGAANFSASADGAVVVWQRRALPTQLVWRDFNGREISRVGKPELYRRFSLSPDEGRLAVDLQDPDTHASGIWIVDLARGVSTRLTPKSIFAAAPMWTHRGDQVVMSMKDPTGDPGAAPPLVRLADGDIRPLRPPGEMQYATSLSSDDQQVVYTRYPGRFSIIQTIPLINARDPVSLESSTLYDASEGVLSPDDRWMAFQSSESGRPEIYLRQFRGAGSKIRVSSDGGTEPRWSVDGRAILFLSGGMLMRADIATSPQLRIEKETRLFPVSSAGMREIPGGSDAEPVAVLLTALSAH